MIRVRGRSLWDWSCDVLAAGIVSVVFWASRVQCETCGATIFVDETCEEH